MKKYIWIGSIILALTVLGIILYPIVKEKFFLKHLEKEIITVNDYLSGKKVNDLDSVFDYQYTPDNLKVLKDSIDAYLKDLMANMDNYQENIKDEEYSLFKDFSDNKKLLEDKKNKLEIIKESFQELKEKKDSYIKEKTNDKEIIELYESLLKSDINFDTYLDKINHKEENLNKELEVLSFLEKNNKTYQVGEESIIFLKRQIFNDYQKLNYPNLNYSLIVDKEAPKITASDITIYKGNSLNVKDKVKCYDEVDGNLSCQISGSFNKDKIGSYSVKITATDTEKNTANKTIKINVKEKPSNKKPYYIEVIRNQNVVIVYGLDSNNEYTKIVKVFVCSVGLNGKTPTGTFTTSDKSSWGWLVGNVYGQYYTRITGSILFHSVPYFKKAKNQLEWEEYNKLGTAASKGCVRLAVRDVKWIYDNCPSKTKVKIYDGNLPSGVSKPSAIKIPSDSPNKGWDPTDPDKNNPWKK